jgi:hypothetical protein
MRALCVVATMLLLWGCVPSAEQPEPNTHLPGFDVWMPKGIVVRQTSHPAIGRYQVRSGTALPALPKALRSFFPERAPSTQVYWRVETTTFAEPADVKALMDGALRGLAIGSPGRLVSLGNGRWTSTYEFGRGKLVVGYARCEPWLSIMFLVGLEGDVSDESIALKIVKSVSCRIGKMPPPVLHVSLRVPDHFGLARNTDEPTYFSTAGGGLVTNFTNGNIARDPKMLKGVLSGMFATVLGSSSPPQVAIEPIARTDGAISMLGHLSGDLGELGSNGRVQIGTLYCPDLDSTAIVLVFGGNDPRTKPLEIAQSLGCPQANAVEPTFATIDAVFSPVCESGDLLACQLLAEYIQGGHATGGVMSLERARARACALGDRQSC